MTRVSSFPFSKKRTKKARSTVGRRVLRCETLEDRRVLATFTVTGLADSGAGSLREAVDMANSTAGADIIDFDAAVAGNTITLTSGQLVITESVTIDASAGARVTVASDGTDRVFKIDDGDDSVNQQVVIDNLEITGGNATLEPRVNSSNLFDRRGGGIDTRDDLTVRNSVITGNSARRGAGIGSSCSNRDAVAAYYCTGANERTVVIENTIISDNTAEDVDDMGMTVLGRGGGGSFYHSNVTISNSTIEGNFSNGNGGALENSVNVDMTIVDSVISGNENSDRSAGIYQSAFGAGSVYPNSLLFERSTISGTGTGTGLFGLLNVTQGAELTVRDSVISNADGTAGLSVLSSDTGDTKLTIENSTISGNSYGGLIASVFTYATNPNVVTISNSTVAGNEENGGVNLYSGLATITNSTISGNSSNQIGGGGIYFSGNYNMICDNNDCGLFLLNSTVTGNSTISPDPFLYPADGAGVYLYTDAVLTLENSIISGNSAVTEFNDLVNYNNYNTIVARYSLIGDNTGSGLTEAPVGMPDADGNLIGDPMGMGTINALLGPLANNGGDTMTHALLDGSPAIDAGDPAAMAGVGDTPEFDQRGTGFTRVFNDRLDMGSYELQDAPGPACDVVPLGGNGVCDIDDLDGVIMEIATGGMNLQFDVNDDEMITIDDRDAWLASAGAINLDTGNPYLLGDANLDGVSDVSDFGVWNNNKFTFTGKWSQGDFNADGSTDVSDFGVWNGTKFTSAGMPVAATPADGLPQPLAAVGGLSHDGNRGSRLHPRITQLRPMHFAFDGTVDEAARAGWQRGGQQPAERAMTFVAAIDTGDVLETAERRNVVVSSDPVRQDASTELSAYKSGQEDFRARRAEPNAARHVDEVFGLFGR